MKKGLLFGVASVLAASSVIAGCGSNEPAKTTGTTTEPAKNEVKPFTLTLRHTQIKDTTKKRLKMLEDVVAATEKAVPGLKIQMEGIDEVVHRDEKLRAEMAAGNPPKIFDLFGGKADAFTFAKSNRLLDVAPILKELGIQDKFANLQEFTMDGKVYGLPMAGYVEGVFYNKKVFKDLGVEVPKTFEEFLAICEKAKAKGITPLAFASKDAWVINMMMNTMFVRTAGGEVVDNLVAGTAKWTDAPVVDAFKKFEDVVKKGYFQEGSLGLAYAEQQNKFKAGEAAMVFDGSWANSAFIDPEKSKIPNDVGFFNFPGMGGKGDGLINGSFSNGYGFSADLTDQQKGAVKEFIKQMYNETIQKRQLAEEGFLPSMTFADNTGVKPLVTEIMAASKSSKGTFPAFDSIVQKKVREELEVGMQQLVGGKTTAEKLTQSLQKVQEEANKEKK